MTITEISEEDGNPPIKGMKNRIAFGDDPLMCGAFISCCEATISQPGALEAFEKDTGFKRPRARSGIEAIVDKACGFNPMAEFAPKFGDWVAETVWGLEGSENDPDPEENEESAK